MLVGQAGKVVSGELGDLVLQIQLAAAGPAPSGSHNSCEHQLGDRGSVRKHSI